jgi:predicted nucleic acid-binding protein
MRRVFADAFFYIAVLNRHDSAHGSAMRFIAAEAVEVVTTHAVLLEVANAMSAPARREACGRFLEDLADGSDTIIRPSDDALWRRALALYRTRLDKEWSFTDCISFVVMGDEGLTEALTGDRHFEQAGFVALLA